MKDLLDLGCMFCMNIMCTLEQLSDGKYIVAIISTTGRNNRGGLDAILRRLNFESLDAPEMFR